MQRRIITGIVVALFLTTAFSMAFADGGNARKGKYLFRKHCRSCHGASAGDLSPSSKLQKEWRALKADTSSIPCKADWEGLSDSDLNDIFTYMIDFAKDSPSPAKCS